MWAYITVVTIYENSRLLLESRALETPGHERKLKNMTASSSKALNLNTADGEGSEYNLSSDNSGIQANSDQALIETPQETSGSSATTITSYESSLIYRTGLPFHRAVVVVTNAALGAGMLNFPKAYSKTGGVTEALTVQACLIVLIIGSFLILGYCGQVHRTITYQDTIRDFCGITAQILCEITVILYMFGSNVAHMILIGDQLVKVIEYCGLDLDRKIIIVLVSCVFILPLCIPEKLKVVSYSSLFGGLGAFYVCFMVVAQYVTGNYKANSDEDKSTSNSNSKILRVFAAVPVICFGFQCHVTAIAVYAELRHPSTTRFGLVTVCATAICTVIYSLTGVFGYLTFGHGVNSDILLSYRDNDILAVVARALIVIVVFSTFAICQFVGRSAVIGLWLRIRKLTVAEIENHRKKRRIITSLIWFFSSLAVAIVVPTIGKAIAIVGALAAHFIFTFPGLCLIQLILQDSGALTFKRRLGLVIGVMYVVIGVFLFGDTVTLALMEDIEGKNL